jgi:hypothetical protein
MQAKNVGIVSPLLAVGSVTLSLPEINNTSRRDGTLL